MLEQPGNIWRVHPTWPICITTNGDVRKDGRAVMGRGIAFQAAAKYPNLPYLLGDKICEFGNHVFFFEIFNLFTFPVKSHWEEAADLNLIERSAAELRELVPDTWTRVYIPRPGCGVNTGGLQWADVAPVLAEVLDDRFIIKDRTV
jgi:hypothetical protein